MIIGLNNPSMSSIVFLLICTFWHLPRLRSDNKSHKSHAHHSPIQVYEEWKASLSDGKNEQCRDNLWATSLKELTNTTVGDGSGVGIRQWLYQTCSQFGYCKSSLWLTHIYM